MKIAVVVRQVLDLIEPVEVADSGAALDYDGATFIVNESDDHALEQAVLLKEAMGASVVAVALDFGGVDDTLYAAAARGADQLIKIPVEDDEKAPSPRAAAAMLTEVLKGLEADLVLVGVQANDELDGVVAPLVALGLELPYVGVIRGVHPGDDEGTVRAFKEYPGAVKAQLKVKLPAVLGILGAEEVPRYVPVSRIRAAMKETEFEEQEVEEPSVEPLVAVQQMSPPEVGERAEILTGSAEEVAARIAEILAEKGVI